MKGITLESLKAEHERVILKHDIENRRSVAIIVNGTSLHIGISKRHEDDQLNRRKGRIIALGRAKRAFEVYEGRAQLRERELRRAQPLSFTVETQEAFTEQAIDDLLSGKFFSA